MSAATGETPPSGVQRVAPEYEGLVTRAIAFALDALAINAVALAVGVAVGLSLSVLSIPSDTRDALLAIGGVAWLLWSIGYFVAFWSATGQTPGNRLLGIRVCRADDGHPLSPTRAVLRLIVLTLAAIPLLAGFIPVLFDNRRRGVHDMVAGSVVVAGPVHAAPRTTPRTSHPAAAGDPLGADSRD